MGIPVALRFFLPAANPQSAVTVHSVPGNALRDARKRQKTPFRAVPPGYSVNSSKAHPTGKAVCIRGHLMLNYW